MKFVQVMKMFEVLVKLRKKKQKGKKKQNVSTKGSFPTTTLKSLKYLPTSIVNDLFSNVIKNDDIGKINKKMTAFVLDFLIDQIMLVLYYGYKVECPNNFELTDVYPNNIFNNHVFKNVKVCIKGLLKTLPYCNCLSAQKLVCPQL